jgi:hypothetical protein
LYVRPTFDLEAIMHKLKLAAHVATNAVTDAMVIFNMGHAMAAVASGVQSMVPYAAAVLSAGLRTVSECKKLGINLPLPKKIESVLGHPGSSIMAGGLVAIPTSVVSSFTAVAAGEPQSVTAYAAPVMLSMFAYGNTALGYSFGAQNYPLTRRFCELSAHACYGMGAMIAAHMADAPAPLMLMFALAGTIGAGLAIANRQPYSVVDGVPVYALGYGTSAALNWATPMGVVNGVYTLGSASLMLQMRCGGVYEAGEALVRRLTSSTTAKQSAVTAQP